MYTDRVAFVLVCRDCRAMLAGLRTCRLKKRQGRKPRPVFRTKTASQAPKPAWDVRAPAAATIQSFPGSPFQLSNPLFPYADHNERPEHNEALTSGSGESHRLKKHVRCPSRVTINPKYDANVITLCRSKDTICMSQNTECAFL